MTEAYICEGLRTPIGRYGGALSSVRPDDMLGHVIREVMASAPGLAGEDIDDVYVGCANQAGEDNRNVGRMALLLGGLPDSVPAATINRLCGSGLDAVGTAARAIKAGEAEVVLAGGVESMSRVPMGSDGGAWPADPAVAFHSYFVPQGISADLIATKYGYSRDDVDAYAVESQKRAKKAWDNGYFDKSEIAVKDILGQTILDHDEHMRPDATIQSFANLQPSFAVLGDVGGFGGGVPQR